MAYTKALHNFAHTKTETRMKKLFFALSIFLFFACQKDEKNNQTIDPALFEVEHIFINDREVPLKADNCLLNTDGEPLLTLTGLTRTNSYIELEYAWVPLTEKLSSAAITSKNGIASTTVTTKGNILTYTLSVHLTNPQAELRYKISTPQE